MIDLVCRSDPSHTAHFADGTLHAGKPIELWFLLDRLGLCSQCFVRIQLDPAEAARRRNEALAQVEANADGFWKEHAKATLRHIAGANRYLTSDDLWEAGLPKPREARAMGPIFLWGQRSGLIQDSGEITRSTQVNCHRMPRRIWRSLIYGQVVT